jgi:aminopeptidase N
MSDRSERMRERALRSFRAMSLTRRAFLAGTCATAAGCAGGMLPSVPVVGLDRYRLPSTVVPRRYDLRIAPDLPGGRFSGRVTVEVTVREPVKEIVLNAAELAISAASARDEAGRTVTGTVVLDVATERARIRFPEMLAPGAWSLALSFTGILRDDLRGFYRARAAGRDGTSTVLGLTQLQAADARRVFPCWDEPSFKAVFEVTLVVDRRLVALANAAAVAEEPGPEAGTKAVRFAPTIPMSTYLVAFVVGDLEATPPALVDGVTLRVWGLPGRTRLAGLGLEVAVFALRFFREYYGVPYPGDKLDLIAVPDFASGAMENFGAVIFRETTLLVDERLADVRELRLLADTVSHEIAHMWFGDLVTMAWWNGLWLNEAFATFMALLAVDAWRPAWRRWVAFGVARAAALETDGLASTRPVEFVVRTPVEAEAMFDTLTYDKGAAVLRMVERHVGGEVFRRGVHAYLARHRFGSTETGDLWTALGEAAALPIGRVMDAWVQRPGYPLVSAATEAGGRTLVLSQRRFGYLAGADGAPDVWHVPLHVRAALPSGVRSLRLILSSRQTRVELPEPPKWVVVNAEGDGFYRTRYSADLLARLASDPAGRLSPIERFVLVDDAWAAVLADLAPAADYLDLTARLRDESDRSVWAALIKSLTYLERVVGAEQRPLLTALVRHRLAPAVAALGPSTVPEEDAIRRELRADLLQALGTLGDDAGTQALAWRLYQKYRENALAVDPSLAAAAIAVSAHAGNEVEYAEFLAQFRAARTPQDHWRYLVALARFREPSLVERTLRLTREGQIRPADAPYLLRHLLMSVAAREAAWRFVREHWEAMQRGFTQAGLAVVCEGVAGLATPELERSVNEFFASRRVAFGRKTLEQCLERLRIAVAFGEREAAALRAYLSRHPG